MTDSNSPVLQLTEEGGHGGKAQQKKQKKQNKSESWRPQEAKDRFAMLESLPEEEQQEIQRALHLFSLGQSLPRTLQEAQRHTYRFWDSQPVPKLGGADGTQIGPITEPDGLVRREQYSLPPGFTWDTLDPTSLSVLEELCVLLSENYIEEDDNTLRRQFNPEYLKWVLMPPGWQAQWLCGLRVSTNQKLVGFISAAPTNLRIHDTERMVAQVNFLCVHRKLRQKRMSPVLIRELTRRVQQQGVSQAVYTAPVVLPTPLATCRFWNRPLSPRKLMDVDYPGLRLNTKLHLKLQRLPKLPKTPGLRPLTLEDIPGAMNLLHTHFLESGLSPTFSPQEAVHWLLPREDVMDSYVVEASDGTGLTDLVSFYTVSTRVLNHPVHSHLREARLLYCVTTATEPVDLVEDTLVLAKAKGLDLFSVLDVMGNSCFLEKLKFVPSKDYLHYYLYNWACPTIHPDKVGLLVPN
ncbi:glycylpeptide N-tetradecanoyltransferase 1-like [Gadus macrocephalus]|uniref:glycylpeptide N-tetradecanoyltransferase 1-like n=1 Tax=Gadus macrocephalus TaxID=80720 RepID=UPI0028CB7D4B|nr:glycylpeptide N-tetradecanoyltransferase 1-like [Gadus macrocephalus]